MQEKEFKVYNDRAAKFYERLVNEFFIETRPLKAEYMRSTEPVKFQDRLKGEYQPIREGEKWGESWDSAWFHLTGEIPAEWEGKDLALNINFNGEALLFDRNGVPIYGLTDGSLFHTGCRKEIFNLSDLGQSSGCLDVWVEAAANNLFGMTMDTDPARNCPQPYGHYEGKVNKIRVGIFNRQLWHLSLDVEILLLLAKTLPERDYRAARIIAALNEAINIYADNPANAEAARKPLKKQLQLPALASAMSANAVGHAHIDTGWLWPVRESIRKCARTFASQVHNIKKYPGYVFGASQPQHYAFVKEHYPELYAKIKECVADGSWEPQGGMWVEADCNIISGESMVRQFLHGKNFFMDEFNFDVRNLWIPDVFGYSAAMPQIIKDSGCDYFLTQKISWSQFNKFPYHTFMWRGIDGTEVLTHFPPEDTYNAPVTPVELIPAQNKLNENTIMDEFMSLFGIGDGGGGPREEHIERALRLKSLEGCPKVAFGRADDFFDRIGRVSDKLPRWVGELYLELHRGTLTTQARTKRGNRKLEQALAATEFLCSCMPLELYPAEQLDKAWKTLLINQFHDILPGSSIGKVYAVTEKEHAEQLALCSRLSTMAAEKILTPKADSAVLVNTLSYDYSDAIELPAAWNNSVIVDAKGESLPVQNENGKTYVKASIPAASSIRISKTGANTPATARTQSLILENSLVRYEFDANAQLIAARDKECGRDLLPQGRNGNVLSLYIDRPNNWDAWDVDIFYNQELLENAAADAAHQSFSGPVRQSIMFNLKIGESTVKQTVSLDSESKRLDFNTKVDWHESRRMLRVSFPTPLFTAEAAFDIQYGFVRRNTHRNTSWDMAKFEVAAQRYADISEHNYGIAILNDCKYGHKVLDNILDLCLLRSPKYPDWDADQGGQVFTYSLLPHAGCLEDSTVMKEAACLNRQPLFLDGFSGSITPPCSVSSEGVTMEVLKKAEKENCHIIRLTENKGRQSQASISTVKGARLVETKLMEWTNGVENILSDGIFSTTLSPFEIRTYKLFIN